MQIKKFVSTGKLSLDLLNNLAKVSKMGFESPAKDYAEARIELVEYLVMNASSTFFMRAETDAMEDAHIPMHSLLVVDGSVPVRSGNVVVAVIDGDGSYLGYANLCRFYIKNFL